MSESGSGEAEAEEVDEDIDVQPPRPPVLRGAFLLVVIDTIRFEPPSSPKSWSLPSPLPKKNVSLEAPALSPPPKCL